MYRSDIAEMFGSDSDSECLDLPPDTRLQIKELSALSRGLDIGVMKSADSFGWAADCGSIWSSAQFPANGAQHESLLLRSYPPSPSSSSSSSSASPSLHIQDVTCKETSVIEEEYHSNSSSPLSTPPYHIDRETGRNTIQRVIPEEALTLLEHDISFNLSADHMTLAVEELVGGEGEGDDSQEKGVVTMVRTPSPLQYLPEAEGLEQEERLAVLLSSLINETSAREELQRRLFTLDEENEFEEVKESFREGFGQLQTVQPIQSVSVSPLSRIAPISYPTNAEAFPLATPSPPPPPIASERGDRVASSISPSSASPARSEGIPLRIQPGSLPDSPIATNVVLTSTSPPSPSPAHLLSENTKLSVFTDSDLDTVLRNMSSCVATLEASFGSLCSFEVEGGGGEGEARGSISPNVVQKSAPPVVASSPKPTILVVPKVGSFSGVSKDRRVMSSPKSVNLSPSGLSRGYESAQEMERMPQHSNETIQKQVEGCRVEQVVVKTTYDREKHEQPQPPMATSATQVEVGVGVEAVTDQAESLAALRKTVEELRLARGREEAAEGFATLPTAASPPIPPLHASIGAYSASSVTQSQSQSHSVRTPIVTHENPQNIEEIHEYETQPEATATPRVRVIPRGQMESRQHAQNAVQSTASSRLRAANSAANSREITQSHGVTGRPPAARVAPPPSAPRRGYTSTPRSRSRSNSGGRKGHSHIYREGGVTAPTTASLAKVRAVREEVWPPVDRDDKPPFRPSSRSPTRQRTRSRRVRRGGRGLDALSAPTSSSQAKMRAAAEQPEVVEVIPRDVAAFHRHATMAHRAALRGGAVLA